MKNLVQLLLGLLKSVLQAVPNSQTKQPSSIEDLDIIKQWEGLRLEAYIPVKGDRWTIGFGHTKTAREGMKITMRKAHNLLKEDVAWVEDALNSTIKVPVTQRQYDALASFVYNVGGTAWGNSTMLKKLNSYDYVGAAKEFPRWNKSNGRVIEGLVNRRKHEQELFMKGTTDDQLSQSAKARKNV